MGDRPNAKPLATNEDSDDELLESGRASHVATDTAVLQSALRPEPEDSESEKESNKRGGITPHKKNDAALSSASSKSTGSGSRRLKVSDRPGKSKKAKNNTRVEDLVSR